MILAVHHFQVTIPEGAEDKARAFYVGALGLQEVPKPESARGRGGLWLKLGAVQIHMGIDDERALTKSHVAYQVSDLLELQAKLEGLGLKTISGSKVPGMERFQCRDPFGNLMEFVELKS